MDGQELKEALRKDVTRDVQSHIKVSPSYKVARFVDQPVLEKTVLSQYGRFHRNMSRVGVVDDIEKARSKHVQTVWGDRLHTCEVPQDLSIEETYFNLYGKGFISSRPDPMHQSYVCPRCGLKQIMDPAVMDMKCPRCGHITPIGQLVKDHAYTRW